MDNVFLDCTSLYEQMVADSSLPYLVTDAAPANEGFGDFLDFEVDESDYVC